MQIAFDKIVALRLNVKLKNSELECIKMWTVNFGISWINFANIHLKKFGQKRFKVVFERLLLSWKKPFWDRIRTSRGWIWTRIDDDELILPTLIWRHLVKTSSKWFLSAHRFREKRDFGTEFELREIEIGLREKGHFETDFEPKGWNWNRIGGWWISFAIVDMWVIWSKALQSDLLNRLKRNSRIRLLIVSMHQQWFFMSELSGSKFLQSRLFTIDTYCHQLFNNGRPQASAAAPRLVINNTKNDNQSGSVAIL